MRPSSWNDDLSGEARYFDFLRVSEVYDPNQYSLWGRTQISPRDAY